MIEETDVKHREQQFQAGCEEHLMRSVPLSEFCLGAFKMFSQSSRASMILLVDLLTTK